MKQFCLLEIHRFALDTGFQPGAPDSACLKPQNAPAMASFCPLQWPFFSIPGVQLFQSGEQRAGFIFGGVP